MQYTQDQLLHLRQSPLVHKPKTLPSIEQWMDTSPDQNQKKVRSQFSRGDEHATVPDHSQRPSLSQIRHSSRVQSSAPDGIVLGPPKSSFASASRINSKSGDVTDRSLAQTGLERIGTKGDRLNIRENFAKERGGDKRATEAGRDHGLMGDDSESWNTIKAWKTLGDDAGDGLTQDDHEGGKGRRDLDKRDMGPIGARRNPNGRSKLDQPWSRDDATAAKELEDNKYGARRQGWRDRDRDRDWRDERDRTRGNRVEAEPEWMDTPAKDDRKQVHTQEEFQRWKERMKAVNAGGDEKADNAHDLAQGTNERSSSSIPPTPLSADGGLDKLVGLWGESKRADGGIESGRGSKVHGARAKPSKFAGFFGPKDDLIHNIPEDTAPQDAPEIPDTNGSKEDREGFQRILQMLGGANLASQPAQTMSPVVKTTNEEPRNIRPVQPPTHALPLHTKNEVQYADSSDQDSNAQSGSADTYSGTSAKVDDQSLFHPIPESANLQNQVASPQMLSNRSRDEERGRFDERENYVTPVNVQSLLGQHLPPSSLVPDRDSEFLLQLMHQAHIAETQNRLGHVRQAFGDNIPGQYLDAAKAKQHSQFHRPPLYGVDNHLIDEDFHRMEAEMSIDQTRHFTQRAPPGFHHEPLSQLQRLGAENGPRHQLGIPHQPDLDQVFMKPNSAPPQQQERIGPPPGLINGNMRQNIGFNAHGLPFPPNPGALPGHPPLQRGMTGPPMMFQNQIPHASQTGFLPGPGNAPPGFVPNLALQDGVAGMTYGQLPPGQRRTQYDSIGEFAPGLNVGRGSGPGQYGTR